MGRRLSNDSPTPWSLSNHGSFVLAGTGIPEYSGDSGVIRDSGVQQKEVPVKKILRKKQESQGIRRNPGRNEKQSPRNDISETGKCNLVFCPCDNQLEIRGTRDSMRIMRCKNKLEDVGLVKANSYIK